MIRRFVMLVLSALLALALAAPASAHISDFDWSVLFIAFGTDESGGSGVITCDQGETWSVRLRVSQKTGYRAKGFDSGTCTGSQDNWSINTTHTGDAVEGVRTAFVMTATSFDQGIGHDKAQIKHVSGGA